MKKLLSIMAMVAVIFATSCQRVEDPTGLGTTSEVTFSVQSPDQLTRAIGDGSEANKLTVAVYDTKGNYLEKVSPTSPITGSKHKGSDHQKFTGALDHARDRFRDNADAV